MQRGSNTTLLSPTQFFFVFFPGHGGEDIIISKWNAPIFPLDFSLDLPQSDLNMFFEK